MSKQFSLFKVDIEHGGSTRKGKAKTRRPLSTRKPLHVTLRSSKAIGRLSLLRHRKAIVELLKAQAERWGVRIFECSVNSNHIHLGLTGKTRCDLQNFFRTVSGLVARLVTQARRGKPFGKFWDELMWSRIAEWGRGFRTLQQYIQKNVLETAGIIPYERPRRNATGILRS